MKKALIHFGPFKTGSSSFQESLNKSRLWLLDRGIFVPELSPIGGHYDWLEDYSYQNDEKLEKYENLIVSSEILSSYSNEKLSEFSNFLIHKNFSLRYVGVSRNVFDSFISFNRDLLRNGEEPYLKYANFVDFQSNPSYCVDAFKDNHPSLRNISIVEYGKNVLPTLWYKTLEDLTRLDLWVEAERKFCHGINENQGLKDGREWVLYLLMRSKKFRNLNSEEKKEVFDDILTLQWETDFLSFQIQATRRIGSEKV